MSFGKWTPFGAFVACMIFGLGQAIYDNNSIIHVSPYLLSMLPYILTLVVLAGLVGRSSPPAADGLPYVPGTELAPLSRPTRSRCAASRRRFPGSWPTTTFTSPSTPARSTPLSARTERARPR